MNTPAPLLTLRDTVHDMLLGVTPERADELQRYWDDFGLQIQILGDYGPDGPVVLDAGGYVLIRFNHRLMRLFWLASFALWEGYVAYQHYVTTGETNVTRFMEILDCFEATRVAADVDAVPWPANLPPPGELVDHVPDDSGRVGGELAIFAVGWAVLHEMQHLLHQQGGTAAAPDDVEACRREEHSCDAFATNFLLARIADQAGATGQSAALIADKRQIGIYCGMFAMTLLSREDWGPGEQHPALQERIDAIAAVMDAHGTSKVAAIIAVSAFVSLQLVLADAPNPFEAVNLVALREAWHPDDPPFAE
ncbi:phage exclusion protein Lit family protein [Xanthomonas campestris]|uniref:phage exclusion protein Lit family protein n=1 Tax=Xanthomonas campestris TaxID=339 RepID=UPI001C840E2C|nr:phage exclusion protein Lit family protein [Xanthomonas campestris]MCC5053895.1 hypothetical protein [Xanthomonas campestris pv. aberrans]MDM7685144.1 phage exclusion protein Lit family protein [Xanthomonas campestris pv. campestris]MDM7689532.1 phage exclusion protein Lit family protein [Xanthomonas campestris pv. campestris]MEB1128297.1 phage exclusion protein Lit family protein [Xanthomonas campestris pv. campestris]